MKSTCQSEPCQINIDKLYDLGNLIQKNIHAFADELSRGSGSQEPVPSWPMYEAQRNLISATGVLTEMIYDPAWRLMEYSGQYLDARVLAIAAAKRVPDLVASREGGMGLSELSEKTGVEKGKLGRVLRSLCSNHIFCEPSPDTFANNRISAALVHNEGLRAFILMTHADPYRSCEHLPKTLFDPEWGPSYDVRKTPFQSALATSKSKWEWLEENPNEEDEGGISTKAITNYPGIPGEEEGAIGNASQRPELVLFGRAMAGAGKATAVAQLEDYPWPKLGSASVVDVGGGIGGFTIQLCRKFPLLNIILQDRDANIGIAQNEFWSREYPDAVSAGRVKFMAHDFFQPNPVQGADVYWMRCILHDWSDEACVQILSAVRESMAPASRLLICDQVMYTTAEKSAAGGQYPLPSNHGTYKRIGHHIDLAIMCGFNGIERTPAQFEALFRDSGLALERIWPCRSQLSILEARRAH